MVPVNISKFSVPFYFKFRHWDKHFVQNSTKPKRRFWSIDSQFFPIIKVSCQPPVIQFDKLSILKFVQTTLPIASDTE